LFKVWDPLFIIIIGYNTKMGKKKGGAKPKGMTPEEFFKEQ